MKLTPFLQIQIETELVKYKNYFNSFINKLYLVIKSSISS